MIIHIKAQMEWHKYSVCMISHFSIEHQLKKYPSVIRVWFSEINGLNILATSPNNIKTWIFVFPFFRYFFFFVFDFLFLLLKRHE